MPNPVDVLREQSIVAQEMHEETRASLINVPIPFPESKLSHAVGISGQLADALSNDIGAPPTPVGTVGKDDPSNSKGEALAPLPAVLSPLHELEESLLALLDTEEMVTEAQEQAFLADLSMTMQATVAKRDRVAAFIKHCEGQSDVAAAEIKRLQARKKILDNAAERVRSYVLWIIEALPREAEGKLRKLEGDKFTFATRKAKPKLEITEEADVPMIFKSACIEMPAEQYAQYRKVLEALGIKVSEVGFAVDEKRLREYLEGAPSICVVCGGDGRNADEYLCLACAGAGTVPPSVPGARLLMDRNSLVLR